MPISQFKNFSIILYEYPTQDLLLLLGTDKYAFIEHCYDIKETGELKKVHYHLYVRLHKKKSFGGVYEILNKWRENCSQPNLIINLENVPKFIRYLTHIDNPEKYQYSPSEIISNFDIQQYFDLQIDDSVFIKNVIDLINEKSITTFKELVLYSMQFGKLDLVSKRAFFFKCLF